MKQLDEFDNSPSPGELDREDFAILEFQVAPMKLC
jgi:hypothetical protein